MFSLRLIGLVYFYSSLPRLTLGWYGNPLGYWLWVPFCTRSRISFRGLYGFWIIGFRVPLRGLSGFWVLPRLVVPAYSNQKKFWEENFTPVNTTSCGRRNVRKHIEIKDSEKYIAFDIFLSGQEGSHRFIMKKLYERIR